MANLIDVIKKYIRPYYYYIIIVITIIVFSALAYYWYNQYKPKMNDRFKDVANMNRRNKEAIVYMFHVDWCPHCKKAMPEWTAFKNQYDGLEINGYVIKCIDIDCTNEKSDVKSAMNKYKITSFPTVKLIKEEQTIDFDSKITRTSLGTFVDTMLK